MPFIPHTPDDTRAMLDAIGVAGIEDLFDEIPAAMRAGRLAHVPDGVGEMEMLAQLRRRAAQDADVLCFAGAGCYDHHVPAAVWDLVQRGEYMTAYTPYQAEASQGTLQLIYEYQSMLAALTGMDVSNASVYDGGSAVGEALLMAVRANRKAKSRRVLVPTTLHPRYRSAAQAIVGNQGLEFVELPVGTDGLTDLAATEAALAEGAAALVINQPNYFGLLEDVDRLTDLAADAGALSIAVVNPLAMAVLKPPGQWGSAGHGADIACGDGQPLGIPMASGGPSFGFMCCRQAHVRQMPGRLIGRTLDTDGRTGFTLTLQAREQHIRRAKATSNICTNQGLLVTAATMHMALLGASGLRRVAEASHANTRTLVRALTALPGVEPVFDAPVFHEAALRLPLPAAELVERLAAERILPGVALGADYPALGGDPLLVCATEQRTDEDIARLVRAVEACL